jgi:hypothetical protein
MAALKIGRISLVTSAFHSCFGIQSEEGSRYMERILTVVATYRMQKKNVLDFISQAVKAHFGEGVVPSLIPISIRIDRKLSLAA